LLHIGVARESLPHGHLFQGKGCASCFGSGYKGRHGVYELMTVNNEIRKQIVKSPDAVELRRIALGMGMTSLLDHGAELARQGITTVAEMLRVTKAVEG
jgi:general secretion pathway protein E